MKKVGWVYKTRTERRETTVRKTVILTARDCVDLYGGRQGTVVILVTNRPMPKNTCMSAQGLAVLRGTLALGEYLS